MSLEEKKKNQNFHNTVSINWVSTKSVCLNQHSHTIALWISLNCGLQSYTQNRSFNFHSILHTFILKLINFEFIFFVPGGGGGFLFATYWVELALYWLWIGAIKDVGGGGCYCGGVFAKCGVGVAGSVTIIMFVGSMM